MRRVCCCAIFLMTGGLCGALPFADDPAADEAFVTDVEGREFKINKLKFTTGTKRLAWMADPKGTTEDARKGMLALELREPISTTFVQGIVTLVPIASLEAVRYDYEKQVASLKLKGIMDPLTGVLGYQRPINLLAFGGTFEGKPVSLTGGAAGKTAVKSATFGGAQPLPVHKDGKLWNIQIVHPKADNPTLIARNLKVLYSFPGGVEQLHDGIPVRKGSPIPFDDKMQRFEQLAKDLNTNIATAEVQVGTGPERVVAIPLTLEQDKKVGFLVGIVGEVNVGWKLFPLHTIKVITPSKRKIE